MERESTGGEKRKKERNCEEIKRKKGKHGREGIAVWRGQQRKGGGIRLNEWKHNARAGEEVKKRRRRRAAGRRGIVLLTQLESCELVVNGVLIQRR